MRIKAPLLATALQSLEGLHSKSDYEGEKPSGL